MGRVNPVTVEETLISVDQERDRFEVHLIRRRNHTYLKTWRDGRLADLIYDRELDTSEAILGNLVRHVRQGGALHKSAVALFNSVYAKRKG